MLALRPNCECCDRDLPADSREAMICTYECTFCADCVASVLHNVCPNCGGNFTPRPIRPAREHRPGVSRAHQLPSEERVHSKYTREAMAEFAAALRDTPAVQR